MFKKIHFFIVAALVFLFISCQKEESFEIGKGGAKGILKMKINGTQWIADNSAQASVIAGFINISGISKDKKTLVITLSDSVTGTYFLNQTSFNAAALSDSIDLNGISYTTNQGIDTSEAGGIVIISQIDRINKTISGTFRFKIFRDIDGNQKQITEGAFDRLPYSANLPPANTTDTFRVKIDNVDWNGKSISSGIITGSLFISASELNLSKTVGVSMPPSITPGTYDLNVLNGIYIGFYNPNATTYLSSDSGKLTILEHNISTKRIRGNFNFIAKELVGPKSAQLTQGYFSVKYQ